MTPHGRGHARAPMDAPMVLDLRYRQEAGEMNVDPMRSDAATLCEIGTVTKSRKWSRAEETHARPTCKSSQEAMR